MPYFERCWGSTFLGQQPSSFSVFTSNSTTNNPNVKLRTIPLMQSVDIMAQDSKLPPERALRRVPSEAPLFAPVPQTLVLDLRDELNKQVSYL